MEADPGFEQEAQQEAPNVLFSPNLEQAWMDLLIIQKENKTSSCT